MVFTLPRSRFIHTEGAAAAAGASASTTAIAATASNSTGGTTSNSTGLTIGSNKHAACKAKAAFPKKPLVQFKA